jgi:hypothetical protein
VTDTDPAGTPSGMPFGTQSAMPAGLPFLDAATLRALVPMTSAVVCVEAALSEGSAPGVAPPRTAVLTGARCGATNRDYPRRQWPARTCRRASRARSGPPTW